MKLPFKLFILSLSILLAIAACKKDDEFEFENELITTVIFDFIDEQIGDTLSFQWRDADLSRNPEIEKIVLRSGTIYTLDITLLDETRIPPDNVTEEIEATADDHQFFFFPNPDNLMSLEYLDEDTQGRPLGLVMRVQTNQPRSGNLRAVLKHQVGTKDGRFETGSTDIDVTFPVRVEL